MTMGGISFGLVLLGIVIAVAIFLFIRRRASRPTRRQYPIPEPHVEQEVVKNGETADAVIPVWEGKPEPLAAFYNVRCISKIEELIETDNTHLNEELVDLINIASVSLNNSLSSDEIEKLIIKRKRKFVSRLKKKRELRLSLTENCNYRCFFCHEEGLDMETSRCAKTKEEIKKADDKGLEVPKVETEAPPAAVPKEGEEEAAKVAAKQADDTAKEFDKLYFVFGRNIFSGMGLGQNDSSIA